MWRFLSRKIGLRRESQRGRYADDLSEDPKVRILATTEDMQRVYSQLMTQAVNVIHEFRNSESRLERQVADVDRLRSATRQAARLAESAKADGNLAETERYSATLRAFGAQLGVAEQALASLRREHEFKSRAMRSAKSEVERNALRLSRKLVEQSHFLSAVEDDRMRILAANTSPSVQTTATAVQSVAPSEISSAGDRAWLERRYAHARSVRTGEVDLG